MNNTNQKKGYKKGFLLVALFIGITVSAYIGTLAYKKYANNKVYEDIAQMGDTITTLTSYSIQDAITGYMNGSGGDCSSNYSVENISAIRIQKCSALNVNAYKVIDGGNDETDGTDSYFMLLGSYNNGCKLYFDDVSNDTYNILLSCDLGDARKNFLAEDTTVQKVLDKNSTSIVSWDFNAIDFTTSTGNNSDGIVKILMRK